MPVVEFTNTLIQPNAVVVEGGHAVVADAAVLRARELCRNKEQNATLNKGDHAT